MLTGRIFKILSRKRAQTFAVLSMLCSQLLQLSHFPSTYLVWQQYVNLSAGNGCLSLMLNVGRGQTHAPESPAELKVHEQITSGPEAARTRSKKTSYNTCLGACHAREPGANGREADTSTPRSREPCRDNSLHPRSWVGALHQ